jgi:hypothetical protein
MEDVQMGGIDKRFEDLDIVAIVDGVGVDSVGVGHVEPRIVREGGLQFGWPKIGPDQPALLAHGIGFRLHARFEMWVWNIGRLHHGPVDREFPAVE